MRIAVTLIFLTVLNYFCVSFAQNNDEYWAATPKKAQETHKEVSELIWEAENTNEIQSEYGSEESSYFNNRGESSSYDDDIGGDSFDSYGY